mmetsp:Transcript_25884/g.50725  ORF Transcript_25884/g.50725 Transcript_25884/m.50725 type:complete len:200 (-) Transcript_25884:36-635(-)
MALLSREWEGSLPFSTRVRLKRDLGEGGFEQLVKLLNEITKGYAEAARFHWEVLLAVPKLKDYFEKNKASAYVLNTATELAASSESTMIAPLFFFELPSRLDLSLMVKSALEITEKNFNREEFSVPQVAILYGGDAAGHDFTLSAIEKQTPILVLQECGLGRRLYVPSALQADDYKGARSDADEEAVPALAHWSCVLWS